MLAFLQTFNRFISDLHIIFHFQNEGRKGRSELLINVQGYQKTQLKELVGVIILKLWNNLILIRRVYFRY